MFASIGVDAAAIGIPRYAKDIMLHRSEETYLEGLLHYAVETDDPKPGNIALWKFGRIYSHAGISGQGFQRYLGLELWGMIASRFAHDVSAPL